MTRIAIVGGGIGGLTAGLALRRAGVYVQIYERAPAFGEVGAGISLTPNAVKGLESLGLGEFLTTQANEPLDQIMLHGTTGEELLRIDRRRCRETYGAAYYQMHRADLLNALIGGLGDELCQLNKQVIAIDSHARGVRIRFDDHRIVEADAVIAADGLRSIVRTAQFDSNEPKFSRHVAWRALVPAERLGPAYVARASINHIGAGRNFVTYPVRGVRYVNMVALTRCEQWAEESWSARAEPTELAEQFSLWTPFVQQAIGAIAGGNLYRWGLFLRKPLDRWVKGRVALLGDAAHPMLPYMGQGASCAIEDAIVLGRCFSTTNNVSAALARYEASRVTRGAMLQKESNAGGERLQALDPYTLRDQPVRNEDSLGIFSYDPATAPLA